MEKTDNEIEIVAKFMGIKVRPYSTAFGEVMAVEHEDGCIDWPELIIYCPNQSWEQLKPVVDKIAEYRLSYPEETAKVCDCKVVVGIQYLYPKVVAFIKYLNSQTSN